MDKITNQPTNLAILEYFIKHGERDKDGMLVDTPELREAARARAESELNERVTMSDVEKVVEFLKTGYDSMLDAVIANRRFFHGYLEDEL